MAPPSAPIGFESLVIESFNPYDFVKPFGWWEPDTSSLHGGADAPTVYLRPPDRSLWDADCGDKMEGTDSECGHLAVRTIRLSDEFDRMDWRSYTDLVDAELPDLQSRADELFYTAWGLLIENQDLIKWALCWATGNPNAGDCVLNRIMGKNGLVNVRWKDISGNASAVAGPAGGKIVFSTRRGRAWDYAYQAWWTDAPTDRICAAVAIAAIALHEVAHLCVRSWGDSTKNPFHRECPTTYLIESAFTWALLDRYPDALNSACCWSFRNQRSSGFPYVPSDEGVEFGFYRFNELKPELFGSGMGAPFGIHCPGLPPDETDPASGLEDVLDVKKTHGIWP